jgi:hypothetical protein
MDVKPKRKYTRKIKVIVNKVVENEDNNMNIVNSTCNEISNLSLNDNYYIYMYITCQKVFNEKDGKYVYREGYQYLFGVLFFFTCSKNDNIEHLIIKSFTINDSKNGILINVYYIDIQSFYAFIDSKTNVFNKYYVYDFVNKDNIIDSLLMNNDLFINSDNSCYPHDNKNIYVNIKEIFEKIK